MKKVGKYLSIVFLLLLGLGAAGVLYLFFVPGSNLFSITYISHSANHAEVSSTENVYKLVVNSYSYPVNITSADAEEISVKVYDNSFGFVLTKNNKVSISKSLDNGTLKFNISEPHGFAIPNRSYIEIIIPKEYEIDLQLTNNNAKTTIGSADLKIDTLTYSTKNGDLNLGSASILGELDLNLGNSTFTIEGTAQTNNNDVILNMTTGKFSATGSILGNVTVKSNTRGLINIKECHNLIEKIDTAGGTITIDKLFHAEITTSDTNVNIKEVTTNVYIDLTKSGNITIENLSSDISSIKTNNGNVTIAKTTAPLLYLETTNGNITVNDAQNTIDAITNNGTITVNYTAEETETVSRLTARINGNGKVVATKVENVDVIILDNGRVDLNMKNVVGLNAINGANGSVNVKIEATAVYRLETKSETGNVRVNLTQIPQYGGYTLKEQTVTYVNSYKENYTEITEENPNPEISTNENRLNIETKSGSLTVLDSNF